MGQNRAVASNKLSHVKLKVFILDVLMVWNLAWNKRMRPVLWRLIGNFRRLCSFSRLYLMTFLLTFQMFCCDVIISVIIIEIYQRIFGVHCTIQAVHFIGTWFHEFLYPLDYLSKYQKDKHKKQQKINKKILYSIIIKEGKQNRSPTEVA